MPQFSRGIVWNERVYNQLPRPLHDYFKGGEDRREELLCDLDLAGYGLLDDWLRMDPADVNCGTDHDLEDEDGDEVEEWGWLELNKEEMIEDDGCPLLALAV